MEDSVLMTMVAKVVARMGHPYPDITLPCLDGGDLALGDLRGKRLLLFYWRSW